MASESDKELGCFVLDLDDEVDPSADSFDFFRRDFFETSEDSSCEDDSVLRLEFRLRLPCEDGSRPGDPIERLDERGRLDCFSEPFGELTGESLPIDGLRLDFFGFSLPLLSGGNES